MVVWLHDKRSAQCVDISIDEYAMSPHWEKIICGEEDNGPSSVSCRVIDPVPSSGRQTIYRVLTSS